MGFLAAAAPIFGALGAGVQAIGAITQGQAQANAANYQAQVARNNAIIEQQNAAYAVEAGQQKAHNESLREAEVLGAIKSRIGANGVDVNTGSAADVEESQRETGKLNADTVLNNAQLQAYGYRSGATSFTAQAGLDEAEAEQAPIGAAFTAGGSLLANASSIGFKWSGATNNNPLSLNAADYG